MAKISFDNLFDVYKNSVSIYEIECPRYLTALFAIENLKQVQPQQVTPERGYMYAILHDNILNIDTSNGWGLYASQHYQDIKIETTVQCLNMIELLAAPFKSNSYNKMCRTIGVPADVARIIQNEDLLDLNVVNTLELSIKNIPMVLEVGDIQYPHVFTFGQIQKLFSPFLNTCVFKDMSEEKLLKKYTRLCIYQYAVTLSCLYRLFYRQPRDYWDSSDAVQFSNQTIGWVNTVPVIVPETVIGILEPIEFKAPPINNNVSTYLSLPQRYLALLYETTHFVQIDH